MTVGTLGVLDDVALLSQELSERRRRGRMDGDERTTLRQHVEFCFVNPDVAVRPRLGCWHVEPTDETTQALRPPDADVESTGPVLAHGHSRGRPIAPPPRYLIYP